MSRPLPNMMTLADDRYAHAKQLWVAPFEYQEQRAGKRIRTELCHAVAALASVGESQAELLCEVVEKFNTASLVHDDIADVDAVRRGAPAVWVKFGVGTALMSGMVGYIHGLAALAELGRVDLLETGIRSLEALHIGQYLDVQVSEGRELPSMEDYRFIAETNTGCFFVFLLDACHRLKPLQESLYVELRSMMLELAVYYRYVNDYCDINHIPHFKKKGFAPDLDEGPKSFIMILAGCMLVKKKRSAALKRRLIMELGNAGVFQQAKRVMDDSYSRILQHFDRVRNLSSGRRTALLGAFLQNVRFEQDARDDYYESVR